MFSNFSVKFPAVSLLSQPTRVYKVYLKQKAYEHDYGKIYFKDWNVDILRVRPGSPMLLTLENKEFAGYVHDVRTYQDNNSNFTEVGFIGASYLMRQANQQVFQNATSSDVAEKLAKKYGFAYKITPHPRVYKQISQAGMTDWELLVKLAKQSGYAVHVENTTLYFQPILKEFEDYILEAPTFSKVDAGTKFFNPLYSFKPIVGETLGHDGADKAAVSVAGIDAETGQYFKYTNQKRKSTTRRLSQPEFFDRHATKVVANAYDIAKFESESFDERTRFPYIAEAEVLGTARLATGKPVYLQNIGSKYTGYWTVLKVEHEIFEESVNRYKYTSLITVGTDSLGESTPRYPLKPPSRGIRTISPAIRNTRIQAKSKIKIPNINPSPTKTVKLVNRINRDVESGPKTLQSTWSSDRGNVSSKPIVPGRSAVATSKVVNYFGRQ